MMSSAWHILAWLASGAGMVVAAGTDIRDRLIMNSSVLLVAGGGLLTRMLAGPEALWMGLSGAAAVFAASWFLFVLGLIGGGDAKLLAATSLLVPASQILGLLMAISLAGGLLGVVYLLSRRLPIVRAEHAHGAGHGRAGLLERERRRIATGAPLPYALAIVGGTAAHMLLKGVS